MTSARHWAAAAVSAVLLAAGCTSTPGGTGQSVPPVSGPATSASPGVTAVPSAAPGRRLMPVAVAPGSGLLRQTMAKPATHGQPFRAMITDLWLAVRAGKAALGRQAFFPVDAYKQVKAIPDPAADWRGRLWLDFRLDVTAAHALLGRHARAARLVRVIVDSPGAAWVGPGACYNRVGYWHVANSRVVYRLHGQERSFGIASLISWRGIWYVVHFGGVVRGAAGMVDAPAAGPGYAGPQGGC